MKNAPFSIWLHDEFRESLAVISHLTHCSQSQIAAKAIAEYVSRNEWKPKNIEGKSSTHQVNDLVMPVFGFGGYR